MPAEVVGEGGDPGLEAEAGVLGFEGGDEGGDGVEVGGGVGEGGVVGWGGADGGEGGHVVFGPLDVAVWFCEKGERGGRSVGVLCGLYVNASF